MGWFAFRHSHGTDENVGQTVGEPIDAGNIMDFFKTFSFFPRSQCNQSTFVQMVLSCIDVPEIPESLVLEMGGVQFRNALAGMISSVSSNCITN